MGIIAYLFLGILIAVVCWAAVKFIPMHPPWPSAIPVVGVVLWLLVGFMYVFGGFVHDYPMPRLR